MKIKTLDIYGYGKWLDQQFDFAPDLQIVYGGNEAGKSTLQSFIRSILFGFPRKGKGVNQYRPKYGESYGGRLLLADTPYGDVWLERKGKSASLYKLAGDLLEKADLDQILHGLTANLYDSYFAFSLDNFSRLNEIGAEDLNEHFLSVGNLGSEKFLELAGNLDKKAQKIFKPNGTVPDLNAALIAYEEASQQVLAMEGQLDLYYQHQEKLVQEEEAIHDLRQTIGRLEEDIYSAERLMDRYDTYLKDQKAKNLLADLLWTDLPDNAKEDLEGLISNLDRQQADLDATKKAIEGLEADLAQLTSLTWAKNKADQRKAWLAETKHIQELQNEMDQLHYANQKVHEDLKLIADRSKFYPHRISDPEKHQRELKEGLALQASIQDQEEALAGLRADRKQVIDQRKTLQHYGAQIRQQLAKIEHQRMNEEERLVQETSLKDYALAGMFLLVALAVGLYHVFFSPLNSAFIYGGAFLACVGLVMLVYTWTSHRQKVQAFRTSPLLDQIHSYQLQEAEYQEESDQLARSINQFDESIQDMESQLASLQGDQQSWLVGIGFYPTADAQVVLQTNPVKAYYDGQESLAKNQERLEILDVEITRWLEQIQPLVKRFPAKNKDVRSLIRHLQEVEASLRETEFKGQEYSRQIAQRKQYRDHLVQSIQADRQAYDALLEASQSKDLDDFYSKYAVNEEINQLNTRREAYQDQIQGHREELEAIESKQAIEEAIQKDQQDLRQLKGQLTGHQDKKARLLVAIEQMEKEGDYESLLQNQANQESRVVNLFKEWAESQLMIYMINQALHHGWDNPIEEMNARAIEIFENLTNGRYTHIKFNKHSIRLFFPDGTTMELKELSQGTLEQLYVALRLAFISSAWDRIQMPIIIDDAFVNFDQARTEKMYEVLEKISGDQQILYFTFDDRVFDYFSEEKIISLQ